MVHIKKSKIKIKKFEAALGMGGERKWVKTIQDSDKVSQAACMRSISSIFPVDHLHLQENSNLGLCAKSL